MRTKVSLPARRHRRGAVVLTLIVSIAALFALSYRLDLEPTPPSSGIDAPVRWAEASPPATDLDLGSVRLPRPFTIDPGQTVGVLLQDLGVEGDQLRPAVAAIGEHVDFRSLRAGESGLAYYDHEGEFDQLRLKLSRRGWVTLEREADTWSASFDAMQRKTRVRSVEGQLTGALTSDLAAAGAPAQLAWSMSDTLRWDLDFNRDLRVGDRFRVVYEETLLDGQTVGTPRVLALEYTNRGVSHEAYYWTGGDTEGYFDQNGEPLRKMFLRSPLPFTRVTSRFTHRRFHPIHKVYRPHYGVDFGAPTGTPVRVTAGGTVTFVGWGKGGAGKMVKVKHANGYETLYLHLNGYAKGLRTGKRVQQGELIAYVGNTGGSTGPHLDYRVKLRGKYLDPMKLDNRRAEPVPQSRLAAFQAHREQLREAFGGDVALPQIQLASHRVESSFARAGGSATKVGR